MTGMTAALIMPVPACGPLLRKPYRRRVARALRAAPFGRLYRERVAGGDEG
jgi:hypothetical protein